MDYIQETLKSWNPQSDQQQILIYGKKYRLWRDDKYLGIYTWTEDENVGDSFQNKVFDKERGVYINQVGIGNKWEMVIKN